MSPIDKILLEAKLAAQSEKFAKILKDEQDTAITSKLVDILNGPEFENASNAQLLASLSNLIAQTIGMSPPMKDYPDDVHICMMSQAVHHLIHDMAHYIANEEKEERAKPPH